MRSVVGLDLFGGACGNGVPRIFGVEPFANASCPKAVDFGWLRHGRLEERCEGHASRVFAKLLLHHVAGGPAVERLPHIDVVTRMLARRDIDEAAARDRQRRTWKTQDETILGGCCNGAVEI